MKHLPVVIFCVIVFALSCRNNSSEEQPADSVATVDSTEKLDTVFSEKDNAFLQQLNFSKYAGSLGAPVDWRKFRMVTSSHEDSLLVSAFQPDNLYYEEYGRLLKYSPDSSMFIDLDSYNIEIQKDKTGRFTSIENGPDTEVSLINLDDKKKTRLVFLGPGNGVEDGAWIDNNTVVLIGYRERDTTRMKTAVIWRYHVPTKTFHVYESADTVIGGQLSSWRKERLRQIL
ncbi:MAG: hypothetical protein H7122_07015 [Chitinophagaceae bacterium]|nr:hypothetical protein [Chitinophagaceae bacterium]